MITAAALAWAFGALSIVLALLVAVVVPAYADLAAENRRLRRDHIRLVHPSRKANR